jgi:hypothetical protein
MRRLGFDLGVHDSESSAYRRFPSVPGCQPMVNHRHPHRGYRGIFHPVGRFVAPKPGMVPSSALANTRSNPGRR